MPFTPFATWDNSPGSILESLQKLREQVVAESGRFAPPGPDAFVILEWQAKRLRMFTPSGWSFTIDEARAYYGIIVHVVKNHDEAAALIAKEALRGKTIQPVGLLTLPQADEPVHTTATIPR